METKNKLKNDFYIDLLTHVNTVNFSSDIKFVIVVVIVVVNTVPFIFCSFF